MLRATMHARALALALALLLLFTQQFGVQHALSHGRGLAGAGGAAGVWAGDLAGDRAGDRAGAPAAASVGDPARSKSPAARPSMAAPTAGTALAGGGETPADGLCPVCLLLATLAAAALPVALCWRAAAPPHSAPVPRQPPAPAAWPAAHYRARAPPARLALT